MLIENLKEFRCSKCNKLLGKIDGRAEIVCPRCKVLNAFGVPPEWFESIYTPDSRQEYLSFLWMNAPKKNADGAANCFECEQLQHDAGTFRCAVYHDAIIEDVREKRCKDSIM